MEKITLAVIGLFCHLHNSFRTLESVILYGSQAKGNSHENSDIDIAVIVDEIPGDYLDATASLWRLSRKVDAAIEPVLLTFDDSDSGFLRTVRETDIAI